jgi:hypothetical protein
MHNEKSHRVGVVHVVISASSSEGYGVKLGNVECA